jgi:acyl-CoA dehydrogenase
LSILYDEAQTAIAEQARRVLAARTDRARLLGLLEQVGQFDTKFWDTVVEQGWTALALPEAHGGLGLGLVELGIVAEACGAATAGAPFLALGYGAGLAISAAGDGELGQRWLPALASGQATGAVAFAERQSPLPETPTTRFADGRLSGTKAAVAGGLLADFAVVWAAGEGGPVLVLAELAGAQREAVDSFDNARLYADLTFDGTPATLLAWGDTAHAIARDILARIAVTAAHEQVGGAEALLHAGRDYALDRKAFGQPIGAFQAIKHRLAELYGLVEIARANAIHAASHAGQPDFLAAAAAARLSATEAYDTAARDVMQAHGGSGQTWDSGLHLHMRRARSLAIELGNTMFWEDLLVDSLVREAA